MVVNANFGLVGRYAISGMKYNDLNGDRLKGRGEAGVPGWDMVLTGTTWFGKPLPARTTTTAADGTYKFERLLPGTYKVSETSRTGWTQTAPASGSYTITFPFRAPPTESKNNDFGNRVEAQSISGVKYNDLNGNGARDPGEPGMDGWTINLEQPEGTVIQTKTTAADGSYSFTGLAARNLCDPRGSAARLDSKGTGGRQAYSNPGCNHDQCHRKGLRQLESLPTNPTLSPTRAAPKGRNVHNLDGRGHDPVETPAVQVLCERAPGRTRIPATLQTTSGPGTPSAWWREPIRLRSG